MPTGDAETLAERIKNLVQGAELRSRFGTAGRAKVITEFNIKTEVTRLHQLMNRALAGEPEAICPAINA